MKNLWKDIDNVKELISRKSFIILFLDFDGTISPIVSSPEKAKINPKIKELLKEFSKSSKVSPVIISGRSLEDLQQKIYSKVVSLAANHGLEWVLDGKYEHVSLKPQYLHSLKSVKLLAKNLKKLFPKIIIEDKKLSIALHYRSLDNRQTVNLKSQFKEIIKKYTDTNLLEVIYGKKVFDIRPAISWTKGNLAKLIVSNITANKGKNSLIICIGDDETDEDMFKKFEKEITIRVGKKNDSKSKYYLSSVYEIVKFLQLIMKSSMV